MVLFTLLCLSANPSVHESNRVQRRTSKQVAASASVASVSDMSIRTCIQPHSQQTNPPKTLITRTQGAQVHTDAWTKELGGALTRGGKDFTVCPERSIARSPWGLQR